MKKKVPATEDVLREQKDRADRKNVPAKPKSTALADASNPWTEIGTELDKYLGAPLLKFNKQGEFALSDVDALADKTRCVAHCDLMEIGWVKWADGRPVDRKVGLIAEKFIPPQRHDLPDRDEDQWEIDDDGQRRDPWSFQMSVPVTMLTEGGETYKFTVGSKGGLRCLGALSRTYGRHVAAGKSGQPIVELCSDFYMHPKYKKIFFPVLHVVGWTGADGKPQTLAEDLDDSLPDDLKGKAA
jgi:hypothetical protein